VAIAALFAHMPNPDLSLRQTLADLVGFDTQNPSGDEAGIITHLAERLAALGAADVQRFAVGPHQAVLARFGDRPSLLLNAHVDTVPANTGYSSPPHQLVERDGRYHALGAADTKGAIAAILEALRVRAAGGGRGPALAVLFSGDEEKGSTVMRSFLASGQAQGLRQAIVCEPTGLQVGHRHRGICSATAVVTSPGGHSSRADQVPGPIAILARVAVALDDLGRAQRTQGPAGFQGLCLNIAGIAGGLAFNVIPTRGELTLSVRPAPGADSRAILGELEAAARAACAPAELQWTVGHLNPPFATRDLGAFAPWLGQRAARPVDLGFWTEAALYAEAGIDAVVFGPGDIAQAHAADEFVEVAQLEAAREVFTAIVAGGQA
jgi:acetylornithine deacetylase